MASIFRNRRALIVFLVAALLVVSIAVAAGIRQRRAYRYLNVFQEVWSLTTANYVEAVEQPKLLDGAYRGMLASLDSASGYLTDSDRALIDSKAPDGRLGVQVLQSGGIPVIVRLDPGSPAEKAGLKRGDQIWRIDGRPTRMLPWSLLTRMTWGEPGREIQLEVLDGSSFKLRQVSVSFSAQLPAALQLEVLDDVIHLRLGDLDRIDPAAARAALAEAVQELPEAALLVDLRGVVAVDPAVLRSCTGWLLPSAASLELVSRSGGGEELPLPVAGRPELPGKLFVLVDSSTAGVAEALAAMLRDESGARLCGRKTYGLAGVPELIPLAEGGSVLLSTREMRLPSGATWAGKGIVPERVFDLGASAGEGDRLLDEALKWIRTGAEADQPAAAAS